MNTYEAGVVSHKLKWLSEDINTVCKIISKMEKDKRIHKYDAMEIGSSLVMVRNQLTELKQEFDELWFRKPSHTSSE